MGIFDRFSKVISSNMNALLDKAEDPQKSVDLLLVQMRDQLKLGKQQLVSAVAEEKMLRAKVQKADEQVEKWQRRAELAVNSGDDELARQALMMKKQLVQQRQSLEATRAQQRAHAMELRSDLKQAEQTLQQMEARKSTIIARYKQAKAGGTVQSLGADPNKANAFDEFERIQNSMEQAQMQADAMQEVQQALGTAPGAVMSESELEARFAQMEADSSGIDSADTDAQEDVQNELDALRKKLRVSL